MPAVVFGGAARAELIEAHNWYSARSAEVAARFIAEIETVVDRLATAPYQFPVVYRDVRRARCRRFPYALFFRIVTGLCMLSPAFTAAVTRASGSAADWPGRLGTGREPDSICEYYKMLVQSHDAPKPV